MSKRQIVVEGHEFTYKVGGDFVRVTDAEGKSRAIQLPNVEQVWRGRRKITSDGMITPNKVEEMIRREYFG